ncbi:ester cyclase [Haladaptatus pallidirubidus]|uniref:Ester cyclase n=1 Tax=Haladaptatus pallidirubidus TaxID=1008152 RepID=A0AAV3UCU1_9EURY|nr:ester cyclase [Haladaptatus pallidirubidus]
MSTITANNEAIAFRDVKAVWNSGGNLDVITDLVSDDFVYHNPMLGEPGRGADGYRKQAETFRDAFSDIEMTVDEMIAVDDAVTIRYTTRATHDGELLGVEPTHANIEITGILVNHLEDGKLKAMYVNDDALGLIEQIGAVEPPEKAVLSR